MGFTHLYIEIHRGKVHLDLLEFLLTRTSFANKIGFRYCYANCDIVTNNRDTNYSLNSLKAENDAQYSVPEGIKLIYQT
jgi:hypothetical protein